MKAKKAWLGVAVGCILLVAVVFGWRAYLIQELRKPVLAQLSDPEAAQFKDERLFGDWTLQGGALCGSVNAKNRLGGYVGFRAFKAFPGLAEVETEFSESFKRDAGLSLCGFERVAPWWHMRW